MNSIIVAKHYVMDIANSIVEQNKNGSLWNKIRAIRERGGRLSDRLWK